MGETKVGLDGWCEGGLGQQRDEREGCTTMCRRLEGVENYGACVVMQSKRNMFFLIKKKNPF